MEELGLDIKNELRLLEDLDDTSFDAIEDDSPIESLDYILSNNVTQDEVLELINKHRGENVWNFCIDYEGRDTTYETFYGNCDDFVDDHEEYNGFMEFDKAFELFKSFDFNETVNGETPTGIFLMYTPLEGDVDEDGWEQTDVFMREPEHKVDEDFEVIDAEPKSIVPAEENSTAIVDNDINARLMAKIEQIARALKTEIEKNRLGNDIDVEAIKKDLIRDCGLMGDIISTDELDMNNPFDRATKEMHDMGPVDTNMACHTLLNVDPREFASVVIRGIMRERNLLGGPRQDPRRLGGNRPAIGRPVDFHR